MTQNLIDLNLSAESLAAIDAALATLETELAPGAAGTVPQPPRRSGRASTDAGLRSPCS